MASRPDDKGVFFYILGLERFEEKLIGSIVSRIIPTEPKDIKSAFDVKDSVAYDKNKRDVDRYGTSGSKPS